MTTRNTSKRSLASTRKKSDARSAAAPQGRGAAALSVQVRRARAADIPQIIELDERVTRIAKRDYWRDIFERYGDRRLDERFFLVAEADGPGREAVLLGLIVGEVRAWEFGSEPCGWVFAFSVDPRARQQRIGEQLFDAICNEFRRVRMRTLRTMVARDNRLHLAFFRSEGMMAGRYIQLEKELD